jgi:putative transcriptional regulator
MAETQARLEANGTVRLKWPGAALASVNSPRTNWKRFEATTEADIARHAAQDDAQAQEDAAAWARQVRKRVGLSQSEFARRIGVPVATVRN